MITHRHKKIKKHLPPTLHLHLHSPTVLKRPPTPDNQRKIMRTQLRLGVWRVRIGISRTGEDRAALDARVEALFTEGEAFQRLDTVFFGGAAAQHDSQPPINEY